MPNADKAAMDKIAALPCHICGEPIAWRRWGYITEDGYRRVAHWACVLKEEDLGATMQRVTDAEGGSPAQMTLDGRTVVLKRHTRAGRVEVAEQLDLF